MVMFDSLNRRMLSPYGCDWVQTPNFQQLAEPFTFTKGLKTLKVDAQARPNAAAKHRQAQFPTALYDLQADPDQLNPIDDPQIEARMCGHMKQLMRDNDAPPEQFERLGLNRVN